jgi:cytochrome c oxidase subunit 2
MASSPRTGRTSNAAIVALAIGVVLVAGVAIAAVSGFNLANAGEQIVRSLYPPIAVTSQGERIRELYTIVFLIAAVIFFVVEGLIIWTVVRYRRKPTDEELPVQTHGNAIAEIVWTVVPTLIVAFLFVISWQTLNTVDTAAAQPDVKLRAVAGQFQWTFEYLPNDWEPTDNPLKAPLYTEFVPTGDDGGLHVPTGKTVKLYLTSLDVIHAFYVPQFLFKRDVVPGRTNVFEFNVNDSDAGQTFRGQCAELCGSGHRIMLFDVHALAPADFDAWLQEKQASAPPPAPSGAAPSGAVPSGPVASGPAPSGPAPSGPAASGPPPAGEGPTLPIAAQNVAFDTNALTAPANTPFKIAFDNKDAGVPHNVAIHQGSPTGAEVFKGEIFPGPATKTYDVPALPAGTYGFVCSVHANMTGTLTVN